MMEAANRGASEAAGKTIGLNISLPMEQIVNPYVSTSLNFNFHYFFMRKFWFIYPAKALVVFPGGFGTMDEMFEVLTLIQTRKPRKSMPVVLFGTEFWDDILDFDALVRWGVVSPEDLSIFYKTDHDSHFESALHPANSKAEGLIACLHRLWSYWVLPRSLFPSLRFVARSKTNDFFIPSAAAD